MRRFQSMTSETRIACQASLVVLITLFLGQLGHFERGYWSTLTALLVMGGSLGAGVHKGLNRAGMTILGCVLGGLAYHFLPHTQWMFFSILSLSLFLIYYFFSVSYRWVILGITMLIVFVFALLGAWSPLLLRDRIFETLLGVIVSVWVSYWFLPVRASQYLTVSFAELEQNALGYLQNRNRSLMPLVQSVQAHYEKSVFEYWFDRSRLKLMKRRIDLWESLAEQLDYVMDIQDILESKVAQASLVELVSLIFEPIIHRAEYLAGQRDFDMEAFGHIPSLSELMRLYGCLDGLSEHPVLLTGLHYYGEQLEYILDQLIALSIMKPIFDQKEMNHESKHQSQYP